MIDLVKLEELCDGDSDDREFLYAAWAAIPVLIQVARRARVYFDEGGSIARARLDKALVEIVDAKTH